MTDVHLANRLCLLGFNGRGHALLRARIHSANGWNGQHCLFLTSRLTDEVPSHLAVVCLMRQENTVSIAYGIEDV